MSPSSISVEAASERFSALSTSTNAKDTLRLASKFGPYRKLVPVAQDPAVTYLNSSFTPPSNLIVHSALTKFAHEALYHPSPKPVWQKTTEEVRQLVAKYTNVDAASIAFTRDTTEALGNFIRSVPFKPGDNVVLLDSEHPNHAYGWLALRDSGLEVRQIPSIVEAERTGKVVAATAETFAPYVDDRTVAIGLSSVMFHSGQKNDVAGICAAFRHRGIHVLADVTQQVGFAPIDLTASGVSAAAFSCHKGLNCPTGLACMYVNPDVIAKLDPTPPIVGFGAVSNVRADLLAPSDSIVFHASARRYEHLNLSLISIAALKDFLAFYLESLGPEDLEEYLYSLGDELRKECKRLSIDIVGPTERQYHAPHLYILDLLDPAWVRHLSESGIYVTPYRLGIRVSLGFYNNFSDIRHLSEVLESGLKKGLKV